MCNTVGHALLIRCTVHQRDTELSWGWSSCCLLTCEESDQLDDYLLLYIIYRGDYGEISTVYGGFAVEELDTPSQKIVLSTAKIYY